MTDHERLATQAADAMRQAGRIPEISVLMAMPDEQLDAIIAMHVGPLYVA